MDVFEGVLRKRPSLGFEILKYLHLWFVNLALDDEDWETAGFLRFSKMNLNSKTICCVQSVLLRSVARKLNLTLQYVDAFKATKSQKNLTALERIQCLFANQEVDVVNLPPDMWLPLVTERSLISSKDVSLHLPFSEEHFVAALVPKSPTESSAFGFVLALPPTVQLLILISFLISGTLHWLSQLFASSDFKRRIIINNCQPKLSRAFFYFYSLIFSQTKVIKEVMALTWSITISFLIIEFLKDQLFTELTTQRYQWPQTVKELSEENEIDVVATNLVHLENSGISPLMKIADRIKETPKESIVRSDDVLGKLWHVAVGKALLAQSNEIRWVQDLLQRDRFAILDEKFFMFQSSFYTSTAWPYHHKFKQTTQNLLEDGFTNDESRPAPMIAFAFRLMYPHLMHKLTDVNESIELTINETKGVFGLLAIGCLFAGLLGWLKPRFKNARITPKKILNVISSRFHHFTQNFL